MKDHVLSGTDKSAAIHIWGYPLEKVLPPPLTEEFFYSVPVVLPRRLNNYRSSLHGLSIVSPESCPRLLTGLAASSSSSWSILHIATSVVFLKYRCEHETPLLLSDHRIKPKLPRIHSVSCTTQFNFFYTSSVALKYGPNKTIFFYTSLPLHVLLPLSGMTLSLLHLANL